MSLEELLTALTTAEADLNSAACGAGPTCDCAWNLRDSVTTLRTQIETLERLLEA